jgi:hypothetical protein
LGRDGGKGGKRGQREAEEIDGEGEIEGKVKG